MKTIIVFIAGAIFGKVIQDSLPILDARPLLKRFLQTVAVCSFALYAYCYNQIRGHKNQEQAFALAVAAIFMLIAISLARNPDLIKRPKEIR